MADQDNSRKSDSSFGVSLPAHEQSIFDEITKLNNELVNLTRELTKKNVELNKANRTISELLKVDHLTGIASRRHFLEYFGKFHALAVRHSFPLTLTMADLDNFKAINDQYGHQVGDIVLVAFARLLRASSREEDLPARFGGEEFIIALPYTTARQGLVKVERLRQDLEQLSIDPVEEKITASFGLTALRDSESVDEIINRADKALYRAKYKGKNRVEVL